MKLACMVLAWLLVAAGIPAAAAPARTQAPFASATLLLYGNPGPIAIAEQDNVSVTLVAANAQDMRMARQFDLICKLPPNWGIRSVGAWIDNRFHLIPLTILEYQPLSPTFIRVQVDAIFVRNRYSDFDPRMHKLHIEFFTF